MTHERRLLPDTEGLKYKRIHIDLTGKPADVQAKLAVYGDGMAPDVARVYEGVKAALVAVVALNTGDRLIRLIADYSYDSGNVDSVTEFIVDVGPTLTQLA